MLFDRSENGFKKPFDRHLTGMKNWKFKRLLASGENNHSRSIENNQFQSNKNNQSKIRKRSQPSLGM